jgi:hypothetical protein
MKPFFAIALVMAAVAQSAHCQIQVNAPMRDASTHADLARAYVKVSQNDPMRNLPVIKGEDPSLKLPEDLIATSDFISFGGMTTLVPKRAILNLPKSLESRIAYIPGSKICSWADFYALNRGWITTVEVSRIQAEGNKTIDAKITERVNTSANLVVATMQGGPISVLPLKVTEESKTAEK